MHKDDYSIFLVIVTMDMDIIYILYTLISVPWACFFLSNLSPFLFKYKEGSGVRIRTLYILYISYRSISIPLDGNFEVVHIKVGYRYFFGYYKLCTEPK